MKNNDFYSNINNLKSKIIQMLNERRESIKATDTEAPDIIWTETLSYFDYLINLPAEDYWKIRLHTSPITGEFVYHYWHKHPFIDPESFAGESGYKILTDDIPDKFKIGEKPVPNSDIPLGITYEGKVVNKDISRYQSCISNLYYSGILNKILDQEDKKTILEIGGGYGGLAHHLGEITKGKATYILLDFPEMLLISGAYLYVNNPNENIYIYDKNSFDSDFLKNKIHDYDYILIPTDAIKDLYSLKDLFLMINMQSFQEMNEAQIDAYAKFGSEKLSGYLYSNNIDRHPMNKELKPLTVTDILSRHYKLFPEPELYNDPSLYSDHPWYYRFYIGTPKNLSQEYNKEAFMKIRAYVPDNMISSVGYHPVKWRNVYFHSQNR
ncbi:putative sugar O-methyltransferase [candidate division KSB1 bacterium]